MKRVLACALLGLLVASGVARAGEGGSWSDKVKLSGDFRYRLETISDDSKTNAEGDTYTQVRHRIRARLYLDAAVSHSLSFGCGHRWCRSHLDERDAGRRLHEQASLHRPGLRGCASRLP